MTDSQSALSASPSLRLPGQARQTTRASLAAWGIGGECVDSAELIVSELITNAVLHSEADEVSLLLSLCGRTLWVEAVDTGRWRHPVAPGGQYAPHGRGLELARALPGVAHVGAERTARGTCAWVALEIPETDRTNPSAGEAR